MSALRDGQACAGRAVKAEPGAAPGRGGAQRSRLDPSTDEFGSALNRGSCTEPRIVEACGSCAEISAFAAR